MKKEDRVGKTSLAPYDYPFQTSMPERSMIIKSDENRHSFDPKVNNIPQRSSVMHDSKYECYGAY